MKNNNSLKSILRKGEDSKTEFKENVSSSLNKEMVAFANTTGGRIYIGITDKGETKGVRITNKLKSKIQDIAQNCDPEIPISLKELKRESILIVEVKESNDKPHKCSSGFYIRSGATTQKLTTRKIRDFIIGEGDVDFGTLACSKFDYKKNFSKEKLFSFLDKAEVTYSKRNIIQLLENLEVAHRQGSKIIFNNAGALFFSKNLDDIHFHAKISCALFKGQRQTLCAGSENVQQRHTEQH